MFVAFKLLQASVRWLPMSVARALGASAGFVTYALLGKHRSVTLTNLTDALGPAASDRTKHYIARHVFMNLGKTALEWFVIDRYSRREITRLVEVSGLCNLKKALENKKGVIALSAHFGNWELIALGLASLGFQGGVLARPLRYPEYEDFLWGMRRKKGVDTIYRGSLKEVARLLGQNKIIGLMPDQDTDSLDGVFVDFFGRSAYTPVGPAALSLITGAAIVPCFIIRSGRKFRIMIQEPVEIKRTQDRSHDIKLLTQKWSRAVESAIRCYPENWVWMHRRWKTRPESEEAMNTGTEKFVSDGVVSFA
jgi:KDO2-lipid IV(A) lauroyltransferase